MLLFSTLLASAYASQSQADRILRQLTCSSFTIDFTVTKKQLYSSSAIPKSNNFYIGPKGYQQSLVNKDCVQLLERQAGDDSGDWTEMKSNVVFDYFSDKDIENCGASVSQDANGILVSIEVNGKKDIAGVGWTPRKITLSCFYKMPDGNDAAYSAWTGDGTATVNGNDYEIKKSGDFSAMDVFELVDVRTELTKRFHPYTSISRMHKPGDPIMIAVRPKPKMKWGKDYNPINQHTTRWAYFIRDCIFSGLVEDVQQDIQLVNKNCKNSKYHIELQSKHGRKDYGHIMIFEAMGFTDADQHYLTCDVDICLQTRDGDMAYAGCYQECPNSVGKLADGADVYWYNPYTGETDCDPKGTDPCIKHKTGDAMWIPQQTFQLEATTYPDTTTSAMPATDVPDDDVIGTAAPATQATAEPEEIDDTDSDLILAKNACLEIYDDETKEFLIDQDEALWELCQYVKPFFPDDF